jgi:ABC-type transport system involved in multi-copper enzyme maturation permease subunit
LARAELHRLTARRLVRWLVVLSALGFLAVWVISLTQFARPSPELLEQARQERARIGAEQRMFCLEDPGIPAAEKEEICATQSDEENFGPVENFLPKQPFDAASGLPGAAVAVAVAVAALTFLIGATYAGAEWSTKSIVALLFWEPRRMRVFLTKLAVLLGAVAVLAALAQLVWLGAGSLLAQWRGSFELPAGFWSDLAGVQGRSVILAVITAALGFGLANLIRNTGAALGAAFAYFVLVENAVRIIRPTWQPYLITENAAALVQRGGLELFLGDPGGSSFSFEEAPRLLLSNQRAALTLALYCLVVLLAGAVLFRRRDLT